MSHPTTISPEEQFEKFRMKYPSIKNMTYLKSRGDDQDCMVYTTPFPEESVKLANRIISDLRLGLVAKRQKGVTNVFTVELKSEKPA